ncbi:MAG: hypothetical protein M1834_009221 [Cirrosporium novae-zelandiae]|nr:MAG: hypothetical protein M1834_009221 [Cirrosporium novae-zelandiae]
MAPAPPRLRIISVGGNAVSAFLSWRLQATNACDVTLVWKSGYDAVAQYGISFKSKLFGNERFKPRHVIRSPEDAHPKEGPFDYVLLCVKALPDVYDLAAVIQSVVTPEHTCILVNTTNTLGVEAHLEERFPTNVVLSLVSGAEITQLGGSEFEHLSSTDIWVGPANRQSSIPVSIQNDMADALAMTLCTGQVDCKVSENIRQQQLERMIGPIAFYPASVLFETPSHSDLLEKPGVRELVSDVIEEMLQVGKSQGCNFPDGFKQKTIDTMTAPSESQSIMYQDYAAKRPMEVETYLGSPIKLAKEAGVYVPRIETLYALLRHCNIVNQTRPAPTPQAASPVAAPPPPQNRLSAAPPPMRPSTSGPVNGMRSGRAPSAMGMPPPMRRGPPMNGYPPRTANGYPPRGPPPGQPTERPPAEDNDLEEFSHLVLYDDLPEGGFTPNGSYADTSNGGGSSSDMALRERELALRQKELQLREQELNMNSMGPMGPMGPMGNMRRGPPPMIRRPPPPASHHGGFDDDDDDDDFFVESRGPPPPQIDPDNFDMMSVTSRRARKLMPNARDIRKNPELMGVGGPGGPGGGNSRPGSAFGGFRPSMNRNRASARMIASIPDLHQDLLENPLTAYSDNRYGAVDRKKLHDQSRTQSLTTARLHELQGAGMSGMNGAYPIPSGRRTSHSPGQPLPPGQGRPGGRPSPPNDGYPPGPPGPPNGRPSPPGMMRQPVPRHPPGRGNAVAPQQVEQHAGVSNLYPPKKSPNVRSLTGSASASAGSGDSGASANIDSENSAHSSQSSLPSRPVMAVR